jgi:hypothetical protein
MAGWRSPQSSLRTGIALLNKAAAWKIVTALRK